MSRKQFIFEGIRRDNGQPVRGSLIDNAFVRTGEGEPINYIFAPELDDNFDNFGDIEEDVNLFVEINPGSFKMIIR